MYNSGRRANPILLDMPLFFGHFANEASLLATTNWYLFLVPVFGTHFTDRPTMPYVRFTDIWIYHEPQLVEPTCTFGERPAVRLRS